jgi:hypothetical protein
VVVVTLESAKDARALLEEIGAPARLVRHGELVAEAAEAILAAVREIVVVDSRRVLLGAWLHDAGKALHLNELERAGNNHEEAGEAMLLTLGVDASIARICRSHAQWQAMKDVGIEDLLVALADSLWKGRRDQDLESRVIDELSHLTGRDWWSIFTPLDDAFERVASEGENRLTRSRT